MKTISFTNLLFVSLFVFVSVSCVALDLSKYQGFMQTKLQPVRKPSSIPREIRGPVISPDGRVPKLSYEDADPAYRAEKLMQLRRQASKDSLSLPPSTRIPENLRPLLSERTHPREGISRSGLSGAFMMPSPGVMEVNKGAIAVHVMPFDLYDINDNKYTDERYYDTNIALTFGAFDSFEFGIDKSFLNQDRFDIPEPVYVNAKYQFPGKITMGGHFCTDSQAGYHSVWVAAGVPAVWVGAGTNFGAGKYRFTYSGYQKLARAKFGGYNYDYNRAEGYADPAFFFIGGNINITNSTALSYDFNGDKFSLGLRLNYQRIVFMDFAFISDGDYERLPGAITHKRMRNFLFGGSIVW